MGEPPAEIEVMRGRAGSSENVAVQVRDVSSGHDTETAPAVVVTVTAPGRTPVRSMGTPARALAGKQDRRKCARTFTVDSSQLP
jgi:hypothetical protein